MYLSFQNIQNSLDDIDATENGQETLVPQFAAARTCMNNTWDICALNAEV